MLTLLIESILSFLIRAVAKLLVLNLTSFLFIIVLFIRLFLRPFMLLILHLLFFLLLFIKENLIILIWLLLTI